MQRAGAARHDGVREQRRHQQLVAGALAVRQLHSLLGGVQARRDAVLRALALAAALQQRRVRQRDQHRLLRQANAQLALQGIRVKLLSLSFAQRASTNKVRRFSVPACTEEHSNFCHRGTEPSEGLSDYPVRIEIRCTPAERA